MICLLRVNNLKPSVLVRFLVLSFFSRVLEIKGNSFTLSLISGPLKKRSEFVNSRKRTKTSFVYNVYQYYYAIRLIPYSFPLIYKWIKVDNLNARLDCIHPNLNQLKAVAEDNLMICCIIIILIVYKSEYFARSTTKITVLNSNFVLQFEYILTITPVIVNIVFLLFIENLQMNE